MDEPEELSMNILLFYSSFHCIFIASNQVEQFCVAIKWDEHQEKALCFRHFKMTFQTLVFSVAFLHEFMIQDNKNGVWLLPLANSNLFCWLANNKVELGLFIVKYSVTSLLNFRLTFPLCIHFENVGVEGIMQRLRACNPLPACNRNYSPVVQQPTAWDEHWTWNRKLACKTWTLWAFKISRKYGL